MHYSDYLCGVYKICFRSPAQLKSPDDRPHADPQTTKIFDYSDKSFTSNFLTTAGLNALAKSAPVVTDQIKSSDSGSAADTDIVPKTCAGDWLLRYTPNETNFNPWRPDAKFSHFELVPWRQQNKRIDLLHAIGWEPFNAPDANQRQLRALQKFEAGRTKRLRKQQLKRQRDHIRRQIKIRFILSLEVRQRAMQQSKYRALPSVAMQATEQRKLVLERDRQMIVFDERAYELSEHWGYFSQRNKGGAAVLAANKAGVVGDRLALSDRPRSSSASSYQSTQSLVAKQSKADSSDSSGIVSDVGVPCAKCRKRCVHLERF